jgi:excisionase family DNA binding protein
MLDVPTAADRLGITVRHMRELIYTRRIPYHKVGRLVRFDEDDLKRWLEANRRPAAPDRGAA